MNFLHNYQAYIPTWLRPKIPRCTFPLLKNLARQTREMHPSKRGCTRRAATAANVLPLAVAATFLQGQHPWMPRPLSFELVWLLFAFVLGVRPSWLALLQSRSIVWLDGTVVNVIVAGLRIVLNFSCSNRIITKIIQRYSFLCKDEYYHSPRLCSEGHFDAGRTEGRSLQDCAKQKQKRFIPGIRPGEQTAKYIDALLGRRIPHRWLWPPF